MKKIVKIKESDLVNMINKLIKENNSSQVPSPTQGQTPNIKSKIEFGKYLKQKGMELLNSQDARLDLDYNTAEIKNVVNIIDKLLKGQTKVSQQKILNLN